MTHRKVLREWLIIMKKIWKISWRKFRDWRKVKSQEMFTDILDQNFGPKTFGSGFKFLGRVQIFGSGFLCELDKDEEQKYIWNGELEYLVPYATISTEESTSPGLVFWKKISIWIQHLKTIKSLGSSWRTDFNSFRIDLQASTSAYTLQWFRDQGTDKL